MDPMQALILQSSMNQRGGQPMDVNTMGLPPGMSNIPPPADAPVGADIPTQSSGYRPMPMREAPRAQETMGNAAMQAIQPMQNMQQPDDSPIFKGIQSAMDAGRKSYELTGDQKRRAEGEAIMAFFGNMANSSSKSVLGSVNQSFMPALNQYNAAEARGMGLNKEVIDTQLKREHETRLLKSQEGGMKVGNQLQIMNQVKQMEFNRDDKRDKFISQVWNNLPEEERTNKNLALIEAEADKKVQRYNDEIDRMKNYSLRNGFDLDQGSYMSEPQMPNAPAIQNPALNAPAAVNPVFKGKSLKQLKAERAAIAAQLGGQ